jgi:hypothetical protein
MAAYTSITAGGTNTDWGFESAETGLFIESMSQSTSDAHEMLMNNRGQKVGFAHNVNKETSISISGEISLTSSGRVADTFGAAVTLANTPNSFFGSAGSVYLTSGSTARTRNGWYSASMNYVRYAEI